MCKTSLMLLFLLSIVHTTTGADYLDITEVRLVDGYGKFSGRVEIKVDGVWGTICDNAFDMNDARVICKSLNLTATSFFTGAHYGLGKGPVFAQRFHCYGHESHLRGCGFDPNTFCSHSQDIGVICTECGEIDIKNGIIESISSNGSVLTTSCVTDYQTNTHTSVCQTNGTWSNDITCATSEEIQGTLLGDSGYPCRKFLMTPYQAPQTQSQERFNNSLCKTRVLVEQSFGVLKRRFPCLSYGLRMKPSACLNVIGACVILHNMGFEFNDIFPRTCDDSREIPIVSDYQGPSTGSSYRDFIANAFFN